LGEVDQLGRLVDQHESQRDKAVDAADRKPIEGELQKNNQFPSPAAEQSSAASLAANMNGCSALSTDTTSP
jgi:hypothetical protein